MSEVLLFSQLSEVNKDAILDILFPGKLVGKTFAYMPSGGVHGAEEYISQWKNIAHEHSVRVSVVDNTSTSPQEKHKLLDADVLLISGGNTFQLLSNLRNSGLDKAIVEFSRKQDVLLAGFSAGALVLTPTIAICNVPIFEENHAGLEELKGLGIVTFELFPHYKKQLHQKIFSEYQKTTGNQVRVITDDEYILVSL